MEQVKIGQEIVSDSGIGRVVRIGDCGSYTAEMIISKEAFIEAFEKWGLPSRKERDENYPISNIDKIKTEIKEIRDSWRKDCYDDEANALDTALKIIDKYTQ